MSKANQKKLKRRIGIKDNTFYSRVEKNLFHSRTETFNVDNIHGNVNYKLIFEEIETGDESGKEVNFILIEIKEEPRKKKTVPTQGFLF